ncbi:FAD-dependent oxidoreductase [Streptomyces zhihengii]
MAARLDAGLRTSVRAVAVDPAARTVTLSDGDLIGFDHLVATGPLDQLSAITACAPEAVRAAAGRLQHTTVAMVGLGYEAPTTDERSWLYFPSNLRCRSTGPRTSASTPLPTSPAPTQRHSARG